MDDFPSPEQTIRKLSREQKIGFVLLLSFGVIAIALGMLQIRNTLYEPFALTAAIPPDVKDAVNDVAALQYRDTDGDGLSDFTELYVYETSPYLKDTDSDGIDDRTEITVGKNPLCAEGKNCASAFASAQGVGGSASGTINNFAIPADPGAMPDFMKDIQDPKKVREMILAGGVLDKATLDQIPDEVLMQEVYQMTKTSFQALGVDFTPLLGQYTSSATGSVAAE